MYFALGEFVQFQLESHYYSAGRQYDRLALRECFSAYHDRGRGRKEIVGLFSPRLDCDVELCKSSRLSGNSSLELMVSLLNLSGVFPAKHCLKIF